MRSLKPSAACCALLGVLLLSACDVTTPSQVTTGEIQVIDVMKTATVDPMRVDADSADIVASDYLRNGSGPMRLVIPFAPGNPLNKAAAQAQGERYLQAFSAKGVKDFRVTYTATTNPAALGVLSYMALGAEPPRNCHHITGYYGGEKLADNLDNNFGCEEKISESKMIARPADLLGVNGVPDDDSKRQGTLVDKYRTGVPNPALTGLSAKSGG